MNLLTEKLQKIHFTRLPIGTSFSDGRYTFKNHYGIDETSETILEKVSKSKAQVTKTTLPARHIGGIRHFGPYSSVFVSV